MKQKHGTSRVHLTTFDGITERPELEGDEYRAPIIPITHTPVDEDEAMMRADFIARARKVREDVKALLDDEYLFSPNLSLEDTQRISSHLRDVIRSIEAGICYVRPAIPKWEDKE